MPTTFPMRRGALIAAAASALLLGTVLRAAERAPERPELEALTSPHEARGELDALCRALLDVVIKRPASRAASLAWIQLEQRLVDSSAEVRRLARQRLQALAPDTAFAGAADRDRALANRDRALALLAHLEAQAGAYEQAQALQDRRGLVRRWLVVGPFGVSPNGDHERVFPPERLGADTPLDLARGFDERGRSRRWRPAEIAGIEDRLVPAGFLEPTNGSAYLLTHLRWRSDRRAQLRITSGASLRLWCNGVRALEVDRARAWGPRTYTVDLVPEGGWQRLLLKVSPANAAVTVTIAGVQGSPRLEITERPALATAPGGRARLLPARAALPERPDGNDADALFATGVEWFAAGAIPDAVGLLSDALERRPGDPWIRLWLARALSRTPHLGAQRRRSEAERHWQTLQQQAPDLYPVRLHTALALKDEGKPVEAFRALAALARDVPDAIAPLREAVSLAVAHRWWREAQDMLARWRARRPASAAALVAAARVAEQRGNPHDAMALLTTAWRHDRSDRANALALLRLALAAGDTGRAQTLLASCERAWPGALEFRYQRARLALAQGDLETSCTAWEEAAERGGGMVEPWLQ
ncbi:MAG: tetratricopeptide repeat protein, partial [Planctomycetota bacterium]